MESWILLLGFLQVASCTDTFHYNIHGDEVTFEQAKVNCQHEGVLTTLSTREEVHAVKQAVAQQLVSSGEYTYWIGLWLQKPACIDPSLNLKGFKWMDGEDKAEEIKWKESPKQTCTHDRCAYISITYNGTSVVDWGLMDDGCKKKTHAFICKVAGKKKIPVPKDCEIPTIEGMPKIEGSDDSIHKVGKPSKLSVMCKNKKSYNLTCTPETLEWKTVDGNTMDLSSICVSCPEGFEKSPSGQCVDIDECKKQPCGPGIECENSEGSFQCKGLTTQPPNDPPTHPAPANTEEPSLNPDQSGAANTSTDILVHVTERDTDYSYIYIPVIIAVLALLVLLVLILAIVACCRRRKRKRSKNLAGKKASKETMALRDSMEKINEK